MCITINNKPSYGYIIYGITRFFEAACHLQLQPLSNDPAVMGFILVSTEA